MTAARRRRSQTTCLDFPTGCSPADMAAAMKWLPGFSGVPRLEMLQGTAEVVAQAAHKRVAYLQLDPGPSPVVVAVRKARAALTALQAAVEFPRLIADALDTSDDELVGLVATSKIAVRNRAAALRAAATIRAQAAGLWEIAVAASQLQSALESYPVRPKAKRSPELLHRQFILAAAEAWTALTGRRPGKSRDGPFVRFAVCLWFLADMPALYDAMGKLGRKANDILPARSPRSV